MGDESLNATSLVEARTFTIRSAPGNVVLRITAADGEVRNYVLSVRDLEGVGHRLVADAALLAAQPAAVAS